MTPQEDPAINWAKRHSGLGRTYSLSWNHHQYTANIMIKTILVVYRIMITNTAYKFALGILHSEKHTTYHAILTASLFNLPLGIDESYLY